MQTIFGRCIYLFIFQIEQNNSIFLLLWHFWLTKVEYQIQGEFWLKIVWYLIISLDWDFMVIQLIHDLVFYVGIILFKCPRTWLKKEYFLEHNLLWWWSSQDSGEIEGFLEMGGAFFREKEGLWWTSAQQCMGTDFPGLFVHSRMKTVFPTYRMCPIFLLKTVASTVLEGKNSLSKADETQLLLCWV